MSLAVALAAGQAPAQPAGPCAICGSDEPFTGTCGSGDPRALCKQPTTSPQAAQQAPAGAADWWRPRASKIEDRVAASGSTAAMACFTDMRTLLQAATEQVAAPAAPSTPASVGWISVKDQLPPCRDDQDYIGINSAGFAGIFNAISDIAGNVYCMMETAEESVSIMSDLDIWKPFIRPLPPSPPMDGESNG